MTAPELKPCPFCGGEASISKDHDPDGSGAFYAVKCHKCRAKSSEIYAVETCNIHFTQVRDAWNRRADLAAVPAQVRDVCSKCFGTGMRIGDNGDPSLCNHCHGDTVEPQPDPRDEVIARLVEALENRLHDPECPCNACEPMLAALAAAKAVQHD